MNAYKKYKVKVDNKYYQGQTTSNVTIKDGIKRKTEHNDMIEKKENIRIADKAIKEIEIILT